MEQLCSARSNDDHGALTGLPVVVFCDVRAPRAGGAMSQNLLRMRLKMRLNRSDTAGHCFVDYSVLWAVGKFTCLYYPVVFPTSPGHPLTYQVKILL